jgi:ADP-ribose pyrophosphatase YjhB (NUDIX family)
MDKKIGVGLGIMVLKNGKILLGKRNNDPLKAKSDLKGEGTWTMPGGKLEFGEKLEDGASREVIEETGLKVTKENLRLISLSNDVIADRHYITVGFLCEEFEGEPRAMEPEVITEWKWFDLNNLPKPIFFPSERILKNYFEKKIY